MFNLINDLSAVTTMKESSLNKLSDTARMCIAHCVKESLLNLEDCTEIDVGIGLLTILIIDDDIKFVFTPSKKLEKSISNSINGSDELEHEMENSIKIKIQEAFKGFW